MATKEVEPEIVSSLTTPELDKGLKENSLSGLDNEEKVNTILLSLKRCRQWLAQQQLDYETELDTRRTMEQEELEVSRQPELDVLKLYESISSLQQQLLDVSSEKSMKKAVLERLLLSHVKMKKLFSTDQEAVEEKHKGRTFADQCEEQIQLCKNILKYQEAFEQEQFTLKDIKTKQAGKFKTRVEVFYGI